MSDGMPAGGTRTPDPVTDTDAWVVNDWPLPDADACTSHVEALQRMAAQITRMSMDAYDLRGLNQQLVRDIDTARRHIAWMVSVLTGMADDAPQRSARGVAGVAMPAGGPRTPDEGAQS